MEWIFHHVLMFFFRILKANLEQNDVTMAVNLWSAAPLSCINPLVNDPTDSQTPSASQSVPVHRVVGSRPALSSSGGGEMMNSDWKMSR